MENAGKRKRPGGRKIASFRRDAKSDDLSRGVIPRRLAVNDSFHLRNLLGFRSLCIFTEDVVEVFTGNKQFRFSIILCAFQNIIRQHFPLNFIHPGKPGFQFFEDRFVLCDIVLKQNPRHANLIPHRAFFEAVFQSFSVFPIF